MVRAAGEAWPVMGGHQGPLLRDWDWGFALPVATSGTTLRVVAVVGWWVITGALISGLLAIRQVERPPRGRLSVLLGPLLLAWVVGRLRACGTLEEIAPGSHGSGEIHVLITVPEDPTRVAALDPLLRAIGPDLGTVTVSRPCRGRSLDRWGAGMAGDGDSTDRDDAVRDLSRAALFVSCVEPRLVVLPDRSVRTLRRLVKMSGAQLVVTLDDRRTVAALRRSTGEPAVRVIGPPPLEATDRGHEPGS